MWLEFLQLALALGVGWLGLVLVKSAGCLPPALRADRRQFPRAALAARPALAPGAPAETARRAGPLNDEARGANDLAAG